MSPMQDPGVQSMQEEQALVNSNASVTQIMYGDQDILCATAGCKNGAIGLLLL
jgi:hypothetical protein